MSLFNTFENAVLDSWLGATAALLGGTVDFGLSTTTPNDDGTNITEPAGGAYARKTVNNDGAEWAAAASGQKVNTNVITFVAASGGNWGLVTHWVLYDGGTAKIWGVLDEGTGTPTPRQINDGDQFRFLAGQLRIQQD